MFLNNPATYLSVSSFRAQPNDYDLTGYTDTQLQDILVRASGVADSYMRRSYQPQEVTEFFEGNGSNFLLLTRNPIIYISNAQLVMPGFAPFALPLGQLLIDYERGTLRTYSPLIFQSLGVANVFPRNGLPIVVKYAFGMGYPIPPPSWTIASATISGSLSNVPYDFTVTSRTQSGESLESAVQAFTPSANGAVTLSITIQPGAFVYRVYAALHGAARTLVAESAATNYGQQTIPVTVTSLLPPSNYQALSPPTADTSAWPLPNAIVEATRLIALANIYEQNNLSNRGVYLQESGSKRISWKSTEGLSGKGVPLFLAVAQELLLPYRDQGVY